MKYKYEPDVQLPPDKNIAPDNLKAFYKFIYDRQLVWHNRFIKKLPREEWTNDPIFKRTKYTNVYRELDRGTLWIHDRLKGQHKKLSFDSKVGIIWDLCVYRLLNKVETFDKIGIISYGDFGNKKKREAWFNKIQQLLDDGVKVWTSAHITLQSNLKQNRITNYQYILNHLYEENDFKKLVYDLTGTADQEYAFKLVKANYGFGPFISYELVSDLGMFPWIKFNNNVWANAGPGCIPGIQLIFPRYTKQTEYMEAMTMLRDYQEEWFAKLELPFEDIWYDNKFLDMRNIEHSLCEFRKYWCETRKVGRPRPLFNQLSENNIYD